MAEEVKLFRLWASPFSMRVEIALKMKGVEYEMIEENVPFEKSPLLLKYNPVNKKVPVLLHNGKPICESILILEYIDETWKGTPIMPQDPYERAMARFWAYFIDDKFFPAIMTACWTRGEEQEMAKVESCELLKILDNELKDKKFFGGDTIGLVDMVANFVVYIEIMQGVVGIELLTKEKFPNLFEWVDAYSNCSIIKEKFPPRDKLLAFFEARLARLEARLQAANAPK